MHILFLTDNFPPEVNAPASRTFEHCREWVQHGHQVTVITTAPNFPKGEVFDGYHNRLWQCETVDGIRVLRVWTYITANAGFLKRTLDYLSFMVTGFLAGLFVRKLDVVIGTSPQFFTNCAAWLLSAIRRRPFVFELRDLWPESIKTVGAMQDNWVITLLERLELFLYRRACVVVAVTHSFRRNLIARGIDPSKIHVVTNGVDLSRFHLMERDRDLAQSLELEGAFIAGYIGTHGMAHSLETLLDAAGELQARSEDLIASRIRLVLLGDGARKAALKAKAAEMNLRNVVFLDTVPKKEVPRYWSLLDVAIIHLRRDPNFTQVIPSKLFECMAMGIPVLHGVEGESADIVEHEAVGQTFEPENAGALVEVLLSLARDNVRYDRYRAACLQAAPKYDRGRLAKDMLNVIEAVAR